ncbi:ankyrin repeat domain-containing protein [Flavivirga rizhaonensis]|uniref:Uncharacterized protein n=1 Tax=Flavivirga rizhaonensis TaxID=2559571 RepID=A0A4S1E2C7_9FLAO|nr:ankyrin repeat domain-containing protein [Flavivirga rizhaonensis]TGV04730.1 hypothetical protein EM932_00990 [Flavivirga rizhaonensis]
MKILSIILLTTMIFPFNLFSQKKCSEEIQIAIENGDLELVKKMIENGENIDCIGEWKQTLLMKAIQAGKEDIALYLINKNADITKVDDDNSSALFKTSFYGLTNIAKILLDKGVDVNQKGYREMTTLMMASSRNQLDLVKFLIKKDAKINLQCNSGYTALTYASNPEIFSFLLKNNANVSLRNFEGLNTIEQFKASLEEAKGFENQELIDNYEKIISILEKEKH